MIPATDRPLNQSLPPGRNDEDFLSMSCSVGVRGDGSLCCGRFHRKRPNPLRAFIHGLCDHKTNDKRNKEPYVREKKDHKSGDHLQCDVEPENKTHWRQSCGDYLKHVFVSLLVLPNCADASSCVEEHC